MPNFQYKPNTDFRTSKGAVAPDLHLVSVDYTAPEKLQIKNEILRLYPGSQVVGDATGTYNCHAYAHANRHAWFNVIEAFLRDDYYQFTPGQLQNDDVVVYVKDAVVTHSGFIAQLVGNRITLVRSKWGAASEVLHPPQTVPLAYGSIVYYLRKRGRFMEENEPNDAILQEHIEQLLNSLTNPDRISQLYFASTPEVAELILSEAPETAALSLYGERAGQAITSRLAAADNLQLPPLLFALKSLRYKPALAVIADKVSRLVDDDSTSLTEYFLLSTFEKLNSETNSKWKSALIKEAIEHES